MHLRRGVQAENVELGDRPQGHGPVAEGPVGEEGRLLVLEELQQTENVGAAEVASSLGFLLSARLEKARAIIFVRVQVMASDRGGAHPGLTDLGSCRGDRIDLPDGSW